MRIIGPNCLGIVTNAGGISAEISGDRAIGFPPLSDRLARRMLESLKIWPNIRGFRGSLSMDIDIIVEILIKLSYIAADFPEIKEFDINPVLITPNGSTALDARIIIDTTFTAMGSKPYAHLAFRPYPEEYVRSQTLRDGTEITLRPIKPEDEPLWFELLNSCSHESIYMRFRYAFHWDSHDVASRYCFIDYDREIALVAELEKDNKRKLIGVGRLITDPYHDSGEFAILVADDWQNKGLGGILTDICLWIAKQWHLKNIIAETTTDNHRMISLFRNRG